MKKCILLSVILLSPATWASDRSIEKEIENDLFNYRSTLSPSLLNKNKWKGNDQLNYVNTSKCLTGNDYMLNMLAITKPSILKKNGKCQLEKGTGTWDVLLDDGKTKKLKGAEGLIPINIYNAYDISDRFKGDAKLNDQMLWRIYKNEMNWVVTTEVSHSKLKNSFPFVKDSNDISGCSPITKMTMLVFTESLSVTKKEAAKIRWSETKLGCEPYLTYSISQRELNNFDISGGVTLKEIGK